MTIVYKLGTDKKMHFSPQTTPEDAVQVAYIMDNGLMSQLLNKQSTHVPEIVYANNFVTCGEWTAKINQTQTQKGDK